ncbi:MAG: alpha amylase N-terminal ig-like domain-containing protein [Phycisphaerales bacterium]
MRTRSSRCVEVAAIVAIAVAAPAVASFPPDVPVLAGSREGGRASGQPASVTAVRTPDGRWSCVVRFEGEAGIETVALAGDFNHWSPTATPMRRLGSLWIAELELPDGVHGYKFVAKGGDGSLRWLDDPRNDRRTPDGHGGFNSLLLLGSEAELLAATPRGLLGDGSIEASAVRHDPSLPIWRQSDAAGSATIRLRTLRDDVESVDLLVERDAEVEAIAMDEVLDDDRFTWWEASLPDAARGGRYVFILKDGSMSARTPEVYSLADGRAPSVRTPDWAKDAIWYQIMVDRFRSGTSENDPDPVRPWTSDWYTPSPWEGRDGQSFYEYYVFSRLYGGDFQGLIEKLDYLKELGVTALYLNPVFQSPSPHKYNATNFVHIDEHYGVKGDYAKAEAAENLLEPSTWTWTPSDEVFLEFLRQAKARGFRVILDGVFNHVGATHPAFLDVRKRGPASPFADWFAVRSWDPFEYDGWAGFGELPVFAKSADGLASATAAKHVYDVTRRWMDPDGDGDPSDGIDGWRLDVPNEVPLPFWIEWRKFVKAINPDAYITGEIWKRADEWLDGRSFDAVMNYPFAEASIAWVGDRVNKIAPSELDRRLAELRLAYPAEVTYCLMNLLDSHDTDRIASMLLNPDREYDRGNREQDGAKYDAGKPSAEVYRKVRLLALLQMTYVGAPMIYYGDEVGMWGSDDPNNRKPMLWKDLEPYTDPDENRVMEEQLEFYRRATALRNRFAALRRGSFRTLLADDQQDVWVFLRELGPEKVLVALNASDRQATVTVPELASMPGAWELVFGHHHPPDEPDRFPELVVPPVSGRVWAITP